VAEAPVVVRIINNLEDVHCVRDAGDHPLQDAVIEAESSLAEADAKAMQKLSEERVKAASDGRDRTAIDQTR
jgi:hypothetical protein